MKGKEELAIESCVAPQTRDALIPTKLVAPQTRDALIPLNCNYLLLLPYH